MEVKGSEITRKYTNVVFSQKKYFTRNIHKNEKSLP